jgi:hypothetical protein
MEGTGEWHVGTPFSAALMAYLNDAYPNLDEHEGLAKIFDAFDRNEPSASAITLKEAAFMKLFCDSYYLHRVMPAAMKARKAAESSASGIAPAT